MADFLGQTGTCVLTFDVCIAFEQSTFLGNTYYTMLFGMTFLHD